MVCGTLAKAFALCALPYIHSLPLTLAHSRMSKKSKCLFFWIFSNSRSSLRDSFRSWITLSGGERVKGSAGSGDAKLQNCLSFECKPHQGGEHSSVHDAFDLCFCITGTLAFPAAWQQMPWTLSSFSASFFVHHGLLTYSTHPSCIKITPGLEWKSFLALVLPAVLIPVYRSISRGQFLH